VNNVRRVGPWLRDDYRGFKRLCTEALFLEPPCFLGLPGGGWSAAALRDLLERNRPSKFPNITAAEKALRGHRVYRWLKEYVPLAVNIATDKTPFSQFRRTRTVVEHIVFASALPLAPTRTDRRRTSLHKLLERLEGGLNDGTLRLRNMAREDTLEELLAEAKELLARRQPKSVGYPWLKQLARELCEQTGGADPKLLLQVAAVCELDCDERTAQRYVAEAKKAHKEAADK
jgi:hypothetical protein